MADDLLCLGANNSIGLVHGRCKEYEKALESFEKSMELIMATENDEHNKNGDEGVGMARMKVAQFNLLGNFVSF